MYTQRDRTTIKERGKLNLYHVRLITYDMSLRVERSEVIAITESLQLLHSAIAAYPAERLMPT